MFGFGRILLLVFVSTAGLWAGEKSPPAERVIILANARDEGSMRIAKHYAEARAVPVANIVALAMPQTETVSWSEFVAQIYNPLQDVLVKTGWVECVDGEAKDVIGRARRVITGHRISYLVVCRGVPLKVAHDAALLVENLPMTKQDQFRVNCGAVDAELGLVVKAGYPINAYVLNPLFRNDKPGIVELASVVKVSRLDGPTVESAYALIDNALKAEREGIPGNAYVDIGGPHAEGDRWLREAAAALKRGGFAVQVEETPATWGAEAELDKPSVYLGWYANDLCGPFTKDGFAFPAGAVALHIHSYSADTLRSATRGWTGPFVARGVTCTVGNVFEPYLDLTHQPQLLMKALLAGKCWGDAVYYSLRGLSWQAVAIGDPLYKLPRRQ